MPKIYAQVNIPSLKKLDQLFAVGNATREEALKVGIAPEKIDFIPNGVTIEDLYEKHDRKELEKLTGFRDLENKIVILRLGRFVPHKGTSWFIGNVMPKLAENVVMVAAGSRVGKSAGNKDDFSACQSMIAQNNLYERVVLLPSISRQAVKILLNTVDIVVSPNIKIPGTMEGFGINVIEAAACERVVIASNIEGLKDAVQDGKNGFFAQAEDATIGSKKLRPLLKRDLTLGKLLARRRESLWKKIFPGIKFARLI